MYAQNHPGLLDALIPQYSYPDMVTQTIHVGDCELLERWADFQVMADPASRWAHWPNRTLIQGLNASETFPNPFTGEPGNSECINGWRGLSPLALNPHFGTAPGVSPEQQASVEWTHFADAVNSYGLRADGQEVGGGQFSAQGKSARFTDAQSAYDEALAAGCSWLAGKQTEAFPALSH